MKITVDTNILLRAILEDDPSQAAEARAIMDDEKVTLVDLRDPRELDREGVVPGAFFATRGML